MDMCKHPEKYTTSQSKMKVIEAYKKAIVKFCGQFDDKEWKKMYEALMAGDPKQRSLRAILMGRYEKMKRV